MQQVATASRDHKLRIYDLDGRCRSVLHGHESDVLSVAWSRGGEELVSSGDDGTIRRWSAGDGRLLATLDLGGAETDTLVCTEDGLILAGNDEGQIIVFDADGRARVRCQAHAAGIKRLVCQTGGRLLISASYDRTFKLWRIEPDGRLELGQAGTIPPPVWPRSCAFAGASRIVFGTFGSSYATYDLAAERWDLSKVAPTPGINAVRVVDGAAFTVGDAGIVGRNGEAIAQLGSLGNFLVWFEGLLLTGGQLGTVFDAMTGKALYQHRSPLNCGETFRSGGEQRLLVGSYTGEGLMFRRGPSGIELLEAVQLHDNAVKAIAANDSHLFSVCATGAAAFHAIAGLALVSRLTGAHSQISNGAVRLPGGRFASVSRDRLLRIWSAGQLEQTITTPHAHSIKCVAALAQGALIATGAYDGTVAIYDSVRTRWIHHERPTASGISCLTPNASEDGFLASSYDGRVYPIRS